MHAEWADVGTIVQLSLHENGFRRRPIAGWIALDELYPTSHHRQVADGLPRRHRYKTACLHGVEGPKLNFGPHSGHSRLVSVMTNATPAEPEWC